MKSKVLVCEEKFDVEDERPVYLRGPKLVEAEWFANNVSNILSGISGRVETTKNDLNLDDPALARELAKISAMVTRIKGRVLTKARIQQWMQDNPDLMALVSKKWSKGQLERGLEQLRNAFEPVPEWSILIKKEILPRRGKYPRLILSSAEKGTLMALIVVKCLEDLIFETYQNRSIKHQPKDEALSRIAREINAMRGRLLEGDGKAWDRTVRKQIKEWIEIPMLEKIFGVIYDNHPCFLDLTEYDARASIDQGKAESKSVRFRKKNAFLLVVLDNFRESGHRITSIGNWLVNFVLWTCCLLDNPSEAVEPTNVKFGKVMYMPFFEGDDSLVNTTSKKSLVEIEAYWAKFGFDMKLKEAKQGSYITFVGCNNLVTAAGMLPFWLPEVCRNLASSCWQNNGEPKAAHGLATMCRAVRFRKFPPLFYYFRAVAMANRGESLELSREDQLNLYGTYESGRSGDSLWQEQPDHEDSEVAGELLRVVTGDALPDDSALAMSSVERLDATCDHARTWFPLSWVQ